jgi:hypothetical protein
MAKRLHTANTPHFAAPMSPAMAQHVEDVRSTADGIDCLIRIVAGDLAAFNATLRDQQIPAARFADAGEWDHFEMLLSIARDQLRRLVRITSHEEAPFD